MSLLQVILVGTFGVIAAYWVWRVGERFGHRDLVVALLLLISAVAAVGLLFPQTFCSAFASLCS